MKNVVDRCQIETVV